MSKGLFADQMGAMALVDELRHRQMEIREHLDIHRREAEVAERIRAYYRSQGIECDDDLVAQGVREFFNQRLVFEAPPMTFWQRFLGRLIVSSAFRFWLMFMLAFAIMFGNSFIGSFISSGAFRFWLMFILVFAIMVGNSFIGGFRKGFTKAYNEAQARKAQAATPAQVQPLQAQPPVVQPAPAPSPQNRAI